MLSQLSIVASVEMDMIWLIIGFFILVAVSAATALYVILRQNGFAAPNRFLHGAMMVLLLKTMLISLIIAIGLFRLGSDASSQKSPEPEPPETEQSAPEIDDHH